MALFSSENLLDYSCFPGQLSQRPPLQLHTPECKIMIRTIRKIGSFVLHLSSLQRSNEIVPLLKD